MTGIRGFVALIVLFVAGGISFASDTAKEQRWADQIVDALMDGEAENLKAGDQEFLAIYTGAADDPPKGGVILMHGIGVHPDWPQVISPLRTALPERGWATLSLQMPVLPNEAEDSQYLPLMDEVAPRLDAGIAFMKVKGFDSVVLVAHSLGAAMALKYLEQPRESVQGVVLVGLSSDGSLNPAVSLANVPVPVLDLYGSDDLEDVVARVPERASNPGKAGYTKRKVEDANHFFDGKEAELIEIVDEWSTSLK